MWPRCVANTAFLIYCLSFLPPRKHKNPNLQNCWQRNGISSPSMNNLLMCTRFLIPQHCNRRLNLHNCWNRKGGRKWLPHEQPLGFLVLYDFVWLGCGGRLWLMRASSRQATWKTAGNWIWRLKMKNIVVGSHGNRKPIFHFQMKNFHFRMPCMASSFFDASLPFIGVRVYLLL